MSDEGITVVRSTRMSSILNPPDPPRRRRQPGPSIRRSATRGLQSSGSGWTTVLRQRLPPWLWRTALGLVVLLVAVSTFGLFAVVGLQVALRFREVGVPELVGQTVQEATVRLGQSGLSVRVEPLARIHPTIPAGNVAVQDPAAGLTTRSRRSVKVWLSSGPSAGSIPALIGQAERGARERLEEDALHLRAIAEIRSGRYPSDSVVAQEPPALGAGSTVGVLINRGERGATYVMPDLIGVYGARAEEVLRARGFRVSGVGDHPYPGVEAGVVLRQFPRAGFQIAHGEAISLEVSQ